MNHPQQRFARRSHIPKPKSKKSVFHNKKSNLHPVEQTLYILINENNLWHLVDEFKGKSSGSSAMEMALRRRGATVRKIPYSFDESIIQVWAKWEHEVPKEVSPWMVEANSKGTK